MKKFLRTLLCGALVALSMSVAAFAAEGDLLISPAPTAMPERQGAFYVMANGEFVTFTDAVPQASNNRSFLPMAATFSQLGFAEKDMTWNTEGLITATKGDLTIAMTMGQKEIVLTKAGQSTTIPTDVAPYVDPATWRTYVPFGLVADALGYNVGWDGVTGTVIIDDVDAIWATNTETYELMDKYLAYSKDISGDKVRLRGDYSANLYSGSWTAESEEEISFLLEGSYDSYTANSTSMQFKTNMDWDLNAYVDGKDVTNSLLDAAPMTTIPSSIDFEMRGDLANGAMYFKSAALCKMLEQPDMANAWFKLDMASSLAGSGMSWTDLMAQAPQELSCAELVKMMLHATPPTSIEMTTTDYLALYNAMLGDSAFVKSGVNYVNDMSKLGIPMSMALTTNSSGTKVNGCAVDFYMSDPTFGEILMSVAMEKKEMAMYLAMDTSSTVDLYAKEGSYLVIEMVMDGTYSSTNKTPSAEPPAGAVIVDLMQLLENALAESAT